MTILLCTVCHDYTEHLPFRVDGEYSYRCGTCGKIHDGAVTPQVTPQAPPTMTDADRLAAVRAACYPHGTSGGDDNLSWLDCLIQSYEELLETAPQLGYDDVDPDATATMLSRCRDVVSGLRAALAEEGPAETIPTPKQDDSIPF